MFPESQNGDISAQDTCKGAVEKFMIKYISSNPKVLVNSSSEPQITDWRQRTRPKK